jgi:hypothetical protein
LENTEEIFFFNNFYFFGISFLNTIYVKQKTYIDIQQIVALSLYLSLYGSLSLWLSLYDSISLSHHVSLSLSVCVSNSNTNPNANPNSEKRDIVHSFGLAFSDVALGLGLGLVVRVRVIG